MAQQAGAPKRSIALSLLCLFSWTSLGLLAIIYLFGLIYKGWITEIIGQYIPDTGWTGTRVTLFFLIGFLMHIMAITGTIFIWKLRRTGYPLMVVPCLLLAVSYFFGQDISWLSIGFYLLLPALFSFFYTRMD